MELAPALFGEPSEAFVFCGRYPTGSNHVHVNYP